MSKTISISTPSELPQALARAAPQTAITPEGGFWLFSLLHVLIWSLVPSLLYQSLPKDTLEGITWGLMWQWGYDKHPPLAAWISAAFTSAFGTTGWPVFLAAQLCVLLTFWAVWRLAKQVLQPWHAVVAVALLEGTYYYSIASVTLNPNIAMLPTWAMLTWASYRVYSQPSVGRWAWVGLWSALAFLAKYQSAILIASLMGALLSSAQGRRALKHPGLLVALGVCGIVLLPHVLWLTQHQFLPFRYLLGYTGLDTVGLNPDPPAPHSASTPAALIFFVEQFLACLLTLALWLVFFAPRPWGATRKDTAAPTTQDRVWLTWAAVGPLTLVLFIGAVFKVEMIARWGIPLFNSLGIFLMVFAPATLSRRRLIAFFSSIAVLQAVMVAGLWWVVNVRPAHTHQAPYSMVDPNRRLATHISEWWRQHTHAPLRYVGGDRWLVSAVCAYLGEHPRPFFDFNAAFNPWLDAQDLRRSGMVIVYRRRSPQQDQQALAAIQNRYPTLIDAHTVILRYESAIDLPPASYWIAMVPPADAQADTP